jgi:CubicO group peptidase (beta-lactamase class C family)
MVLDHQAGLPVLRASVTADALMDHAYMAARLAEETPFWAPGSRTGYHPFTYGFLIAEVVRRVTGQTLGQVFASRIAAPGDVDLHIGLSEADEARVAPTILWKPDRAAAPNAFFQAVKRQGTLQNLFAFNHGTWATRDVNTRRGRAAENGAAGGMASARGLCSLLAPLLAPDGLARLGLRRDQVVGFSHASAETTRDEILLQPMRFSTGFMAAIDARAHGGDSFLIGPRAFGHVGAGGSITLVDPEKVLALGYVMNAQGAGLLANPRGQSLIEAAYQACVG